jgi:hypothetical protein
MAKFDMNHNNISYPSDRMGDIEPYEFNRTNKNKKENLYSYQLFKK